METFDKTIIMAKEAFSSAYKKTGEIINIQKQKLALAAKCTELEKLYAEFGRMQYKKICGQKVDDSGAELIISDIKNQLKEMKALKEIIDKAEGKVTCPICGTKAPAKSNFCNSCGASFDSVEGEF